jgi:hypothetical protein
MDRDSEGWLWRAVAVLGPLLFLVRVLRVILDACGATGDTSRPNPTFPVVKSRPRGSLAAPGASQKPPRDA